MGQRSIRLVVASIVVACAALGVPAPGTADPFIENGNHPHTGNKPDSWNHTYCFGPGIVNVQLRNAATAAMDVLAFQSGPYQSTLSATCATGIDIVFEQAPISGAWGTFVCTTFLGDGTCDQATVVLATALGFQSAANQQHTACHEVGHTVGLTHHPTNSPWACMRSGLLTDITFNAHQVNHMNGSFGNPIGQLDAIGYWPGIGIVAAGWALDPDVQSAPRPEIWFQIDTFVWQNKGTPAYNRSDITTEYPYWTGNLRGYLVGGIAGPGTHSVCVWAFNAVFTNGSHQLLGCQNVVVP